MLFALKTECKANARKFKKSAPGEDRTHGLQIARVCVIMRLTRYLLRYRGTWDHTLKFSITSIRVMCIKSNVFRRKTICRVCAFKTWYYFQWGSFDESFQNLLCQSSAWLKIQGSWVQTSLTHIVFFANYINFILEVGHGTWRHNRIHQHVSTFSSNKVGGRTVLYLTYIWIDYGKKAAIHSK